MLKTRNNVVKYSSKGVVNNMKNKICKIVYFDEESVTDYIQIVAGGIMENTTELFKLREGDEDHKLQATAKVELVGFLRHY